MSTGKPARTVAQALAFMICMAVARVGGAAGPAAPNVLFFITDDESAVERSAYGGSKLPTPAFDRVAKDGVLFANGFATAPSCAPSRASVLTGWRNGSGQREPSGATRDSPPTWRRS
jgi:hypothetical protein